MRHFWCRDDLNAIDLNVTSRFLMASRLPVALMVLLVFTRPAVGLKQSDALTDTFNIWQHLCCRQKKHVVTLRYSYLRTSLTETKEAHDF